MGQERDYQFDDCHIQIGAAITLASMRHQGQVRKGTNVPYIAHPMKVYAMLVQYNQSLICQLAGICHDLIEDSKTTLDEIARYIGEETATIVNALTLDKSLGWKKCRIKFFDYFANPVHFNSDDAHLKLWRDIWITKVADAICNLEDLYLEYTTHGEKIFKKFNASKADEAWYYSHVIHWAQMILYGNKTMEDMLRLGSYYYLKVFGEDAYNKTLSEIDDFMTKWGFPKE